ncbi:hypothetical protein AYL99_04300 [Fonsecaea erecta]|uniref:Uncharacterized protein n=1 Tax=Fonsecaea erecta TaxID=1367422 RepID=A0A178ZQN5_9EURO|nr:hypothetical protein AYL99_04300 [Fonsecaea erecta]OAP62097.1 hypothetical protein AYL99_04300 [Fonsecaea erecta]
MAQSSEMTRARLNGAGTTANPRKRNVARFDPDMTIGTPGNGGPVAKKPRISVSVGDKSNFSITPFLNRTLSILPETPAEDEAEEQRDDNASASQRVDGSVEDEDGDEMPIIIQRTREELPPAKKPTAPAAKRKGGQHLKERTNSKTNKTVKNSRPGKVIEEDSDVESDRENTRNSEGHKTNEETTEPAGTDPTTQEATRPLRKPKTLAKRANIFDEEDSAPAPKIRILGGGLPVKGDVLGRINLKPKVGRGKPLTEFSPLKKDRRAGNVTE